MPLQRFAFIVHLRPSPTDTNLGAPDVRELPVSVEFTDQLRTELEGPRRGITPDTPIHLTTMWCYHALVRTGQYAGKFQDFKDRDLVGLERVSEDGDEVDPTQPGESSGSASH